MLRNKLLIFSTLLFLWACSSTTPQVVEKPVEFTKPNLTLPSVEPVQQLPFEWKVIVQGPDAFFSLTPDGYHSLAIDMAQLRSYIEKQNAIISSMKQYYETSPTTQDNKK